ncbi:MAG TPA: dienelactone hydrolase family protein [Armatimonadota bacterium]|nr:dienelactone hydrolase family protein [Armatimonadota bacterium]HOS43761.1 dienelactone hydrolase family protein [Armatimonadota bacterium]
MSETEPVTVTIPLHDIRLPGDLGVPAGARGLVIFAHGSGSSRRSPRHVAVARALRAGGMATLLFDLLTPDEGRVYARRFDIALLTERLIAVTRWALADPRAARLAIGFFGASTGAAAALRAAAELGHLVRAVVSRGGRPDLALSALARVAAPTLLIVGGEDDIVIDLNRRALAALTAEKALAIIPGATHLFEEPGALDDVARLALDWFQRHLADRRPD